MGGRCVIAWIDERPLKNKQSLILYLSQVFFFREHLLRISPLLSLLSLSNCLLWAMKRRRTFGAVANQLHTASMIPFWKKQNNKFKVEMQLLAIERGRTVKKQNYIVKTFTSKIQTTKQHRNQKIFRMFFKINSLNPKLFQCVQNISSQFSDHQNWLTIQLGYELIIIGY